MEGWTDRPYFIGSFQPRPGVQKAIYLEPEKFGGEECSQLLVKPYNNNNLQEGKQRVRINLLITHSINSITILQNTSTSSEFISSENQLTFQCRLSKIFCKTLAKTEKRCYDHRCSKRLRNRVYIKAANLRHLTKEATDLVDQEV